MKRLILVALSALLVLGACGPLNVQVKGTVIKKTTIETMTAKSVVLDVVVTAASDVCGEPRVGSEVFSGFLADSTLKPGDSVDLVCTCTSYLNTPVCKLP